MTKFNSNSNIVINGTSKADFIYNDNADNVTIYAGEGNDQITNDIGSYVYLDGGDGNDVLITDRNEKSPYNGGDHSTLIGGNGDDTIDSYADNVLIDAGEGNDFVTCTDLSTVMSGTGEDLIWIYGNNGLNPPLQIVKTIITDFDENKDILMFNYDHLFENSSVNNFSITKINNGVLLKNKYYQITLIGQTTEKIKNATIAGFIDYDMNTMQYIKKQMKLSELMDSTAVNNNNVINNSNNNTLISGTNGNDSIINSGSYVTVNTGAGNDTLSMIVSNSKNNYYLTLSDFSKDDVLDISDSISGFRVANVTTVGFRLLSSYYLDPNLIIDFPNIKNDKDIEELKKVHVKNGNALTTMGELLKDIVSIDDNATIYGTNDDDIFIEVNGKNALVYGYDGKDEIHFNNTDIGKSTVYAGKGNDYVGNPHNDLRFSQDSGIRNGDGSTFYGEDGDDHFNLGNLKNVTLNGDSGKDQLSIYCSDNVVVNGGDSDDYINVVAVKNATLDGGNGNDEIRAVGNSEHVTISGGKGNDNIYLFASNTVIQYQLGDGNDVVENYGTEDKIKLLSGKISKAELNGNDVVITIGDGSITLKDAKGKQVTVLDSNNKTITFTDTYEDSNNNTTDTHHPSQKQVIQDFMKILIKESKAPALLEVAEMKLSGNDVSKTAVKNLDNAVIKSSNGVFRSADDLIKTFYSDINNESNIQKFLINYCNIYIGNEDTGAITGSDVSGINSDTKTTYTIIPENNSLVKLDEKITYNYYPDFSILNDFKDIKASGNLTYLNVEFQKRGLNVIVSKYNKLSNDEKTIVNALYSWWIDEALKLIEDSYGISFNDNSAKRKNLIFVNSWNLIDWIFHKTKSTNTTLATGKSVFNLAMWINTDHFTSLNLEDNYNGKSLKINESIRDAYLLDREIAHELTHGIMESCISSFEYLPKFLVEGMAELTIGADDRRNITGILRDFYNGGNRIQTALSYSFNYKYSINGDSDDQYTSGYILLRYFMKKVSENTFDFSEEKTLSEIIGSQLLRLNATRLKSELVHTLISLYWMRGSIANATS